MSLKHLLRVLSSTQVVRGYFFAHLRMHDFYARKIFIMPLLLLFSRFCQTTRSKSFLYSWKIHVKSNFSHTYVCMNSTRARYLSCLCFYFFAFLSDDTKTKYRCCLITQSHITSGTFQSHFLVFLLQIHVHLLVCFVRCLRTVLTINLQCSTSD